MSGILLTGASGVLGRALLDEIAPHFDIVCLRHRSPVRDPRVREVTGDLARADLGMSPSELRDLARTVDVVVHSAASTGWTAKRDEVFATNVGGTEHILGFARRSGVPFYHVSTAFVSRPQRDGESGVADYIASKIAAERAVLDSGGPAVILRPSIVMGDSRDGHISAFQGLHRMIGFALRGSSSWCPPTPVRWWMSFRRTSPPARWRVY